MPLCLQAVMASRDRSGFPISGDVKRLRNRVANKMLEDSALRALLNSEYCKTPDGLKTDVLPGEEFAVAFANRTRQSESNSSLNTPVPNASA